MKVCKLYANYEYGILMKLMFVIIELIVMKVIISNRAFQVLSK
jgi:hypothetical protein